MTPNELGLNYNPSNLNIFLIHQMEWATGIAFIKPFHKITIFYLLHVSFYIILQAKGLELINIFQIPRFQNYYDCFSIEIET